jgi:hypothetical protein
MQNGIDIGSDLMLLSLILADSAILESISDEKIEAIARELGSALSREFMLLLYKKIDLESYVEYLSLLCRYGGFAHFEVEKEGRDYTITLLHTYGQKWSTSRG